MHRRSFNLAIPSTVVTKQYPQNTPDPIVLLLHIIAFSPGFMAPADQVGEPQVFISHGTDDQVLPIDRCSRRIVPQLQQARYDLLYREFNGGLFLTRSLKPL